MSMNLAAFLYLVSGVLFIMALRGLSHPTTSRRGNMFGMIGMGIAILTTLALAMPSAGGLGLIVVGLAIGGGAGAYIAQRIPMTASITLPWWQDLTPRQIGALAAAGGVAVLPLAAIEQHGEHLPLSTDLGTCCRLSRFAVAETINRFL